MIPYPHLTHSTSDILGSSISSRMAHQNQKKVSFQHRAGRKPNSRSPKRKKTHVKQLPKSIVEKHLSSSYAENHQDTLRKFVDPKFIGNLQAGNNNASFDPGAAESGPGLFFMETENPQIRHDMKLQKQEEQKNLKKQRGSRIVGYLEQRTHFEPEQVRTLLELYKLLKRQGNIDRMRLREILHSMFGLTDDLMMDRIYHVCDLDKEGGISESEWVIALSVILRGTLDEQIAYCYDVYDVNRDQAIGREELFQCLRGSLYPIPELLDDEEFSVEEGTRELVELTMKKLDVDRDGSIRFGDFYHAVQEDPLLIQAIGPCMPKEKAMMSFLALMDPDPRSFKSYLSHPSDVSWKRDRAKHDNIEEDSLKKKGLGNDTDSLKKRRLSRKKSGLIRQKSSKNIGGRKTLQQLRG